MTQKPKASETKKKRVTFSSLEFNLKLYRIARIVRRMKKCLPDEGGIDDDLVRTARRRVEFQWLIVRR